MRKLMEIKSDIKSKDSELETMKNELKERSDKLRAQKKMDEEIGFQF